MKISAIIPVRNEEAFIVATLNALLDQDFPTDQCEILVVDGRSDDRTREIVDQFVRQHPRVSLHDNPKRWSSAARNVGIAQSTGEYVVIIDGHCDLRNPQYFASMVAAFENSGADCLGRPQPMQIEKANRVQEAIGLARSCWLGHHPDSYIFAQGEGFVPAHSVAVAYRRTVFGRIGLFDESFDACEDVELNHRIDRAGLRCFWTDRIALTYVPRGTIRGLVRQLGRYGRGRVRLMRKHPELVSIKSLAPAIFLAAVSVGCLIAGVSRPWAMAYLGCVLLYFTIIACTSVFLAASARRLLLAPIVAIAFFAIHFGAGWGSLTEAVFGRRMVRNANPACTK